MTHFHDRALGNQPAEEFQALADGTAAAAAIATVDALTLAFRERREVDISEVTGAES